MKPVQIRRLRTGQSDRRVPAGGVLRRPIGCLDLRGLDLPSGFCFDHGKIRLYERIQAWLAAKAANLD